KKAAPKNPSFSWYGSGSKVSQAAIRTPEQDGKLMESAFITWESTDRALTIDAPKHSARLIRRDLSLESPFYPGVGPAQYHALPDCETFGLRRRRTAERNSYHRSFSLGGNGNSAVARGIGCGQNPDVRAVATAGNVKRPLLCYFLRVSIRRRHLI